MANIASAKKRARQMEKRRQNNASHRSMLRTQIRKILTSVEAKDKEAAASAYKNAMPVIDRLTNKGIIHKNKAARHKRQLNTLIRNL